MPFTYQWDDDARTIIRLVAPADWNWKDYHHVAQVSRFAMTNGGETIDVVLDFRNSQRTPRGIHAHGRTFGKPDHPKQTGRTIIIGLDSGSIAQLTGDDPSTAHINEGHTLYFVATDAEAQSLLSGWRAS